MGNKSPLKQINENVIRNSLQLLHLPSATSFNTEPRINDKHNSIKQAPIELITIDEEKLFSILNLAHSITSEHLRGKLYQREEGIYSSALLYQCGVKEGLARPLAKKSSLKPKSYRASTLKAWLKDSSNPSMTPISHLKSSFVEDLANNDSVSLLRRVGSSKLYGSCDGFKKKTAKGKPYHENRSDGFSQRDEALNISKEYNSGNIAIQEENEKSINCRKEYFQWKKRSSIKTSKTYDPSNKAKSVIAYSKQVRDKCLKIFSKQRGLTAKACELNETLSDRRKKHNSSLMNFLYENLNECKDNREGNGMDRMKKRIQSKDQGGITDKENDLKFSIDIRDLCDELKPKNGKPSIIKASLQLASSNKKKNCINCLTSLEKNKKEKAHSRFISTIDHLLEVDPHNRTKTIKGLLIQRKEKEESKSKQKALALIPNRKLLLTKKETDVNHSSFSFTLQHEDNQDPNTATLNRNSFILTRRLDECQSKMASHHFEGISSIKPGQPNRNQFQLKLLSQFKLRA